MLSVQAAWERRCRRRLLKTKATANRAANPKMAAMLAAMIPGPDPPPDPDELSVA